MNTPAVVSVSRAAPQNQSLDCAGFELMLAEVLDRDLLPPSGRRHLRHCPECSSLLASFESIADRVRQLPPDDHEPGTDLWPHIAARLRQEGIIHNSLDQCRASLPAPQLVHRAPTAHR
ncbi:MAG: hypothetical protein ACRD04_02985 [Terriglobales bacterium]